MWPYLVSFTFSIAILSVVSAWNRKGVGFWFWTVVALLIPCLLAGFRAETIGTDVAGYAKPLFDLASNSSSFADFSNAHWYRYWRDASPADFEVGYVALVWVSARVFHSFPVLLLLTQALTVIPVFAALLKLDNKYAVPFGMATYYFLYFNVSLNMMRQWIAMAIILFCLVVLYRRGESILKQLPCFVGILAASLFHTSALFGLFPLLLLHMLERRNSENALLLSCVMAILAPLLLGAFGTVLGMVGLGRYVNYIGGQLSFMPNQVLIRLPLVLFAFWTAANRRYDSPFANFLLVSMLFGTALSQLVSGGENNGRIALYFDSFSVLVFGTYLAGHEERESVVKVVTALAFVSYLVFYWWFSFCYMGRNATVPYLLMFG